MTIEQMKRMYQAQPFQPFLIHLPGKAVPVLHQEFMAFLGAGRTVFVSQPDGSWQIIDLLLVSSVEVRPDLAAAVKKRKR